MTAKRDRLVEELFELNGWVDELYDSEAEMIADFILADRKRIVDPIYKFRSFIVKHLGTISWDEKDANNRAIDETLINAGIEVTNEK